MATRIRHLAETISDHSDVDAILRQLPVGVIVAEAPSGRFLSVNARAERLWLGSMPEPQEIAEYSRVFIGYASNGRQYASDEWPLARAIRHGETVTDEEIEFRFATGERRIMLVSATPVQDVDGEVRRAVALFHDITEQRQEERRREFLMALSDELRLLEDEGSMLETAVVAAGEHLGVRSASYAEVDAKFEHASVRAEYRNGRVVSTGRYALEDFGPDLIERLIRGESVVVEDIGEDLAATPEIFEGWGIRSVLAAPIVRQGRLVALFSVLHSAPRHWTRSDRSLVEHVAERTWHAVESARVQTELRQSREWLTLSLRAGSAAIWEWDLRTGEIHWSEEQEPLLGLPLQLRTLTFSRWLGLVHPDDRAAAREAARRVATALDREVQFEYRVGQQPRWITMRGRVISDARGLPYRVVGVAVDTTERKAQELEREQLLHEARNASDGKSHFISVISHEFRTPLTAIIGYTDLLSSGVSGPLSPAQARQLDRVRTSAWHLTQLVDEILTFSRIEAGSETLRFDLCDVVTLARDSAALIAPAAAIKGVTLACELPDDGVTARTDSGKLRQVLLNLLGNAVKFTDQGSVTLRVQPLPHAVEFTVSDTGIGITEEDRARIFERFWQVAHTTRTVSGAGLGLTVSKRLVELLGGDLDVQSEPGAGSTFCFRIPT